MNAKYFLKRLLPGLISMLPFTFAIHKNQNFMKRFFTISLLIICANAASAQSGTILVGGDVAYSSGKGPGGPGGDFKSNSLSFNPYIGYQFNNHWTAGVVAGISTAKQEQGPNEQKGSNFSAGPFVRYTKTVSDIFALYGQLEGRFGSGKSKSNGITLSEGTFNSVNLFPAAFINLKNNFGLNFNFGGISYGSNKPEGGESNTNFNLNFGKVANIGISKNFGGKRK
ncbi:MAG: porin family protein [Chitinophagaceae bacterium]|nr:MAG: porin family protein [Chitinophagaceae bacterium]